MSLSCVYCQKVIAANEDAQRVSRKEAAHTAYAWAVDGAFFVALDTAYCKKLSDVSPTLSRNTNVLKAGGSKARSEKPQKGASDHYAKITT